MKFNKLSILEMHEAIKNKQTTIYEITKQAIKEIKENISDNAVLTIIEKEALELAKSMDDNFDKNNLLFGIPYLAKDNISTKNIRTTCSSRILKDYIPAFDATIIDSLNNNKTICIGKTALDELGMGGTGLLSGFGPIYNPRDKNRLIGGSSSGSAWAVSKGIVPFAIATDTGDSIRKPASYNGIVGFKPTYGSISRHGLLPYAPSLDTIGFFTRNIDDMSIVCDTTYSYDDKDFTSIKIENKDFYKNINNIKKQVKFGTVVEIEQEMPSYLLEAQNDLISKLVKDGYSFSKVNLKKELIEALNPIYMMISFTESVSSNANLTGINFGTREPGKDYIEIMKNSRSNNLDKTVQTRFLIGSWNLKQENQINYLYKAKKVRRLIVDALMNIFNEIDILITPAAIDIAPLITDKTNHVLDDILTLGNFAGLPSISIPFMMKNNLPINLCLNSKPKNDLLVLQAAKLFENYTNIKDMVVDK